jgi:hypothetical protein
LRLKVVVRKLNTEAANARSIRPNGELFLTKDMFFEMAKREASTNDRLL